MYKRDLNTVLGYTWCGIKDWLVGKLAVLDCWLPLEVQKEVQLCCLYILIKWHVSYIVCNALSTHGVCQDALSFTLCLMGYGLSHSSQLGSWAFVQSFMNQLQRKATKSRSIKIPKKKLSDQHRNWSRVYWIDLGNWDATAGTIGFSTIKWTIIPPHINQITHDIAHMFTPKMGLALDTSTLYNLYAFTYHESKLVLVIFFLGCYWLKSKPPRVGKQIIIHKTKNKKTSPLSPTQCIIH